MVRLQRLAIEPAQREGSKAFLTSEQRHYLANVLRLQDGDRLIVMDGGGQRWLTQLANAQAEAHFIEQLQDQTELNQPLWLMAALPKGQGFEDVVRCVAELGVTGIMPILASRSVMDPGPKKLARWRRIATESAELAQRQRVPVIEEPCSLTDALSRITAPTFANYQRRIGMTNRAPSLWSQLQGVPMGTLLLIGPEGGWTDAEQQHAFAAGFQPFSLGSRVLRTVTASISAVALLAAWLEGATATSFSAPDSRMIDRDS